ncbi:ABC transporter ATP-binding protein [Aquisalimonas sp. 2447]|uniref:ABC transporter ATP-binding protein n=1 Tax=Aquisalimonas sp. 2447 TaxID=2740807 RepID=UPI0020C250D4|nr:ABC transporter ATP-binding protein [Aquisalimonas sp. 2447]
MSASLTVQLRARAPIPLQTSFQVAPGEVLALVGPSGSGKTTVLRAIAGLHRKAQGLVRCGNRTWLDSSRRVHLPPQQRRVGMVFQDYALFPHLTALDNLLLAMESGPMEGRREQAHQLLARVRLDGLEQRLPRELSGGQQQRVAVARALARDPNVLLLDEPFSAVDMMTRERLQRELALLRRQIEIPMILVTHDLQEATALGDRICVLHEGTSLQTETPERLFRHPSTPHVARLLGRHNVFTGTIVRRSEGERLAWGELELELGRPTGMPHGARVHWYVPDSDILLHRRGRPSRGERENPVTGTVTECVVLGAQTSITLHCHATAADIRLSVSTHAARRNGLEPGAEARVSLLSSGIHVMTSLPEANAAGND